MRSEPTNVLQATNSATFPIHFGIATPNVVCVQMQRVYYIAAKRPRVSELSNEWGQHIRYNFDAATPHILAL